jgi:hypothetical protein
MKITGHKTFKQHQRYTNMKEQQVLRAFVRVNEMCKKDAAVNQEAVN